MKTAAVIGANGFLGSSLVRLLLQQNVQVSAVYNSNSSNIDSRCKLYTVKEFLESDAEFDCLFFVVGNYANTYEELLDINNRLLYSITQKYTDTKFIYVSSVNVYGIHTDIISEFSSFNNPGTYGLSKLAGEFIVKALPHYAIIRLTYIYGPGITNSSFIPRIIKNAKEEDVITLFGKGNRKQDYIYIDDAAQFCIAASATTENDTYLGATGISHTNSEVANEISKWTGCSVKYVGEETGESYRFDPSLTFAKLKWKPSVSLSEGIKRLLR